jgi:hypothetical protein
MWPADLKHHLKSKHGQQKSTLKQSYTPEQQQQPYMFTPEQQQQSYNPEQQQHEIQWKTEEPFWIIPTKDPDNFVCADASLFFFPFFHTIFDSYAKFVVLVQM